MSEGDFKTAPVNPPAISLTQKDGSLSQNAKFPHAESDFNGQRYIYFMTKPCIYINYLLSWYIVKNPNAQKKICARFIAKYYVCPQHGHQFTIAHFQ